MVTTQPAVQENKATPCLAVVTDNVVLLGYFLLLQRLHSLCVQVEQLKKFSETCEPYHQS